MRTIYLDGDMTEEFILSVLPKQIIQTINSKFMDVALPRKEEMAKYLDQEKLPSIKSILTEAETNLIITSKANEAIIITFNSNTKVEGKPIMPLLKLLEFGNMDIKGLYFINKAFDEIEGNLNNLYHLYELGGVK